MFIARDCEHQELEQAQEELGAYGYTKIAGYLTQQAISKLLTIVDDHYQSINQFGKHAYQGVPLRDENDKVVYSVYNLNRLFLDLLVTPLVRQVAMGRLNDEYYRFLPDHVPNYILLYYNARSSGRKLDLHIDSHIPILGDRTIAMQFAFLLEDSGIDNGCTYVVPGSHKSGVYANRNLNRVEPITGRAGDLVIWDSRIWHGAHENITGKSRWALIATLGMWWMKQSQDITRGMSDGIYKECSDEQKQLLGFCSIPPADPMIRINTKSGYDFLLPSVTDYYR